MTETPSEVLIKQVQKIRVRRGWSQQDLAERLQALGLPMDRSILAKLESGKRGVSVDEALTLAVALDVSPTSLLMPRDDFGSVRITPGKEVETWSALLWFRGALPLIDTSTRPDPEEVVAGARAYLEEVPNSEAAANRRYPGLRSIWVRAGLAMQFAAHPEATSRLIDALETLEEEVKAELQKARRELDNEDLAAIRELRSRQIDRED